MVVKDSSAVDIHDFLLVILLAQESCKLFGSNRFNLVLWVVCFNCWKISSLAENTTSRIVFDEVLAAAEKDIATKDVSRLRGGWPVQDVFHVNSYFNASVHLIAIIQFPETFFFASLRCV